jgi:acetate kinase
MRILALNAGSSSIKFAVFDGIDRKLAGKLSGIGEKPLLEVGDDQEAWEDTDAPALILKLLPWIEERLGGTKLDAVGHRVVHGGREFSEPVRVDADILDRIEALTPLAPLHQPASVAPMRRMAQDRPDLPQVACFDTAFHHYLAPPVSRYPLPRKLEEEFGIRRYGFHGLSYEAIAGKLAVLEDGAGQDRIIVAHLGSGASLCAMAGLRSVDTSMGFTALDGIMMATRPGTLDPGILLYLLHEKDFSPSDLEDLLYQQSGLLGVSGISGDVSELIASQKLAAQEAVELYTFSIARQIAGMVATLGGLDRLVFTGGVGEHSPAVRAMVSERLRWLGIELDETANRKAKLLISAHDSGVKVQVVGTDEEGVIARHVLSLLS